MPTRRCMGMLMAVLFAILVALASSAPAPGAPGAPGALGGAPTASATPAATGPARDDSAAEKLGWHLGVQAYTFRGVSFYETIDLARSLGLKYV
jgi:hypothetical protein